MFTMKNKLLPLVLLLAIVLGGLYWVFGLPLVGNPEIPTTAEAIARGGYIYNAGGCAACHQVDEAEGATGGYVIEVENPFPNTFYTPNITPDEETGIGGWTGRDFLLAMKHGRSPEGGFYWPSFPYRTYKNMTDEDVLDLAAFLMVQPPISNEVPDHVLEAWQFDFLMSGWNILADTMEGEPPSVSDDPQIQRGAYLARALGHCGECHTPRNELGMMSLAQEFSGSEISTAQINPEGLSSWTAFDFVGLLQLGMTASFDFVGGEMADVVEHTSQLSEADQEAYAAFFKRE
ncbi:MAG: cytochrome c [Gammaproteobacteria bacterium]|nr:cytochrome c [Gammaproteobacteria bacterium]